MSEKVDVGRTYALEIESGRSMMNVSREACAVGRTIEAEEEMGTAQNCVVQTKTPAPQSIGELIYSFFSVGVQNQCSLLGERTKTRRGRKMLIHNAKKKQRREVLVQGALLGEPG